MAWFAIAARKFMSLAKERSKVNQITINISTTLNALGVEKPISYNLHGIHKGREQNKAKGGENMKVRVDKETCVGDETCVEVCPEAFEMQGDVAIAKEENVPKDLEEKVKEAATSCPVEAIIVEE
jgi:ferredoxin